MTPKPLLRLKKCEGFDVVGCGPLDLELVGEERDEKWFHPVKGSPTQMRIWDFEKLDMYSMHCSSSMSAIQLQIGGDTLVNCLSLDASVLYAVFLFGALQILPLLYLTANNFTLHTNKSTQ